ncbi:hypothetical protein MW887_004608 [Aspergillus wentii]|nr:hypothetical protein MW887_004608 [Aspergillus wentii]
MDAPIHHHVSEPSVVVAIVFASIACYNSLEIIFWIFVTFKNRHGLYFWSMQFAAWGTIVNVAFGIIYVYLKDPSIGWSVGIFIGLWAMTTGQAVALYSRLHLVVIDSRKIRWVLYMIIATFLVLHIPVMALFYALITRGDPRLYHPEQVYIKLVATGLSVQEFIICGIYIYEAVCGLKPVLAVKGRAGRQVILNLIIANGIVVIVNATVMMPELEIGILRSQQTAQPGPTMSLQLPKPPCMVFLRGDLPAWTSSSNV